VRREAKGDQAKPARGETPKFEDGFLHKLFGDSRESSITAGIMYGVPPFGYNYLSPEPPLFATHHISVSSAPSDELTSPCPISAPSSQQLRRRLLKNRGLACQPESRTAKVCRLPVAARDLYEI